MLFLYSSLFALLHLLELLSLLILQQFHGVAAWQNSSHRVLAEHVLGKIPHLALHLFALHLYHLRHIVSDHLAVPHQLNYHRLHVLENCGNLGVVQKS